MKKIKGAKVAHGLQVRGMVTCGSQGGRELAANGLEGNSACGIAPHLHLGGGHMMCTHVEFTVLSRGKQHIALYVIPQ